MKQLIVILSILSLLLFGVWGCSEQTDQSNKETVGAAKPAETVQAGAVNPTEVAKEKAKKVIEELQTKTPGSAEETKGSE